MMRSSLFAFFIFSLFSSPALAQAPLSDRIANYNIEVTLDPQEKMLHGKEVLRWKNPSSDTIRELQFHLYVNAFKNNQSSFQREIGRSWGPLLSEEEQENCDWGWSRIDRVHTENGEDWTKGLAYFQPDDDNTEDQTVMRLTLPRPVLPYDSLQITLDFTVKIPKNMIRMGYSRDYYFLAQWFPKIGVYEPAGIRFAKKGQWNCHQYHANTEYYANFGVYEVAITVPSNYIVGSSGVLQHIQDQENTSTHTYRVEDVIDFTWTASPDFIIREDHWNGVDIRLLHFESHNCCYDRYLTAAKQGLDYFEKHLAKYPYPTLTIVDPPYYGIRTAGMEYSTLITGGTLYGLPRGVPMAETFAIHELTHQFFQQIVATNEQEEAWLDEGFTTYWEGRIMNHYYGEKTSSLDLLGFQVGNIENYRISYLGLENPQISSNSEVSWQMSRSGYSAITYNKTATWLRTLEGLVGWDTMNEIMRTYFERWKYKHPCGTDFVAVVNEVVAKNHGTQFGESMDWFFEQTLYGTGICDYELAYISNDDAEPKLGVFGEDCRLPSEEGNEKIFESKVMIYRRGEVKMPVSIVIGFENGETIWEAWDGQARYKMYQFEGASKVIWAEIDPDRKIFIDKNFNNNSITIQPKKTGLHKWASNFLLWMQNVMQAVTIWA